MVHGANIRLSTMDLSILSRNKVSLMTLDEKYLPIYEKNYTLPYRKEQVKKRFNYVMHDITHRKVIYMKNGK